MTAAGLPLNDWRYEPINRHDVVTIRIIWVAFFLSLLVHLAALLTSPPLMRSMAFDPSDKTEPSQALIAQLAPRATPSPPESAPPPTPPSRPSQAAPPPARSAPRPSPPPPPIVRNEPAPSAIPPPPPTPPAEVQPTPSRPRRPTCPPT